MHSIASNKTLREQSQDVRDTQRRAKTYRVGRPLGPADQDRHAAEGPHLHRPGNVDEDVGGMSARDLAEEGVLYAITQPQEPRGHGTKRNVTKKLFDVPKAMLELVRCLVCVCACVCVSVLEEAKIGMLEERKRERDAC